MNASEENVQTKPGWLYYAESMVTVKGDPDTVAGPFSTFSHSLLQVSYLQVFLSLHMWLNIASAFAFVAELKCLCSRLHLLLLSQIWTIFHSKSCIYWIYPHEYFLQLKPLCKHCSPSSSLPLYRLSSSLSTKLSLLCTQYYFSPLAILFPPHLQTVLLPRTSDFLFLLFLFVCLFFWDEDSCIPELIK